MNIVLRHEKAKLWLAEQFNELTPEQFNETGSKNPLLSMCIPDCPDGRREFSYGWKYVYPSLGSHIGNPYLGNAIVFLSRKFPKEMVEVAKAFGVKRECGCITRGIENCDCLREALPMAPWLLIRKLPDFEPDGKRTVFELMADAIKASLWPKPTREEREKKAKRKLRENPTMTAEELGRQLHCSPSTVVRTQAWQENQKKPAARKAKAETALGEEGQLSEEIREQGKDINSNRQYPQVFSGRNFVAKTDDNSDDDNIDDC